MKKVQKTYTVEFKREAVRLVQTSGKPIAQVARELGISDRGSQYTSLAYQAVLAQFQIQVSMSGKGDCYDNAMMESFFSSFKTECVQQHTY